MIQLFKLRSFYLILYFTLIIVLLANAKIKADQEIKIYADKIYIDEIKNIITATGDAIAIDKNDNKIKADKLYYDRKNSSLKATGNVIINDELNNIFFLDQVETENGIDNIVGNKVSARLDDNSRIIGSSIIKKDEINVLSDAEFTPCLKSEYLIKNCPGWKLKSDRIYQDKDSKTIYYDHARIHLFNIPVLYLPYFSHPDPSVKKRSGLLMPTVETDAQLGDVFSIPIFYNINTNQDITFTPTLQSQSNDFYSINYRLLNELGLFNIDASIDNDEDNNGTKNHIFFDASINNPYGKLDAFLKTSNNDTYMRRNKINKLTVLNSGLKFAKSDPNKFLSIESNSYKHLTITDAEQWEYIYPRVIYNLENIQTSLIEGNLSLKNNLLYKKDLQENYTTLLSSQINWRDDNVYRDIGLVFNNESNLRVVTVSKDNKNIKDSENMRFYPQISSKISYPLIRQSKQVTQTISPIIIPILAPYNNYTLQKDITESNIFSLNRASSITEWEGGPRINYGIEWFLNNDNGSDAKLLIGQTYRVNKNKTDTSEEISDYYISSNVTLNKKNNINNSFIIDRKDIDVKSINMNTYFNFDQLKFALDYDYTSGKYAAPKEQIAVGGEYQFIDNFFLKFTGSKNLDTNKNIGYQYGLVYENGCLGIDFNYYRDLTQDRDISESDGFSFTIVLKPFGSTKSYGKNKVFGPRI